MHKSPDSGSCKDPRIFHWADFAVDRGSTDVVLLALINGSLFFTCNKASLHNLRGWKYKREMGSPPSSPCSGGDASFLPCSGRR